MDEFTIARDRDRAIKADAIMQNEIIQEAYKQIEADMVALWMKTTNDDDRRRCWDMVQINRKHQEYLRKIISDGKVAEDDLNSMMRRRRG